MPEAKIANMTNQLLPGLYILDDDNNAVECSSIEEHSTWCSNNHHRFRVDETLHGDWKVSTVFLRYDHSLTGAPPLLFETMLFWEGEGQRDRDFEMERCSTWEQAVEQHQRMVSSITP